MVQSGKVRDLYCEVNTILAAHPEASLTELNNPGWLTSRDFKGDATTTGESMTRKIDKLNIVDEFYE
jgi:hypothetical protein